MNLVFVGASRFGLRCLELACRSAVCRVTGVVTAPQTFSISYRPKGVSNVLYADLASYAADRGLACHTIGRSMGDPALLETVRAWRPDAFLVAGWYHMLPKSWREVAPAYGLHASLLPDYSGGAPLVWAMINGESRTGITLFQMDDGVDSGPIVSQAEVLILGADTIATLYSRIEERGLALIEDALPKLADGSVLLKPQPTEGRRVMPQRCPEDGLIDWSRSAAYVERFVRAQTRPYPGAFFTLGGSRATVWRATAIAGDFCRSPGSSLWMGDRTGIACGEGAVLLDEVEVDGCILEDPVLRDKLREGVREGTQRAE